MGSLLSSVLLLAVGLVFLIAFFALRWLWRRGRIGRFTLGLAALGVAWAVFEAIYPSEAVYIAELERLVGVRLPSDVKFVEKTASFPDIHGDYSACFIVRLTAAEMVAFKAALETGVERSEAGIIELTSCNSVARPVVTGSSLVRIDLSPRATRPDATILAQIALETGLVKIEWDLW